MSEYDDRKRALRERVSAAQNRLGELSAEERAGQEEELHRLGLVLAYVAFIVEQLDPALITEGTYTNLSRTLETIAEGAPYDVVTNARPSSDALIGLALSLPRPRDEDLAQRAKESAATFQRSAQQRLQVLGGDISAARSEVQSLHTEIEQRGQQLSQDIEAREAELREKIALLEGTINTQTTRIDELVTQQDETFRQAQAKRDERATEHERELQEQLDSVVENRRNE